MRIREPQRGADRLRIPVPEEPLNQKREEFELNPEVILRLPGFLGRHPVPKHEVARRIPRRLHGEPILDHALLRRDRPPADTEDRGPGGIECPGTRVAEKLSRDLRLPSRFMLREVRAAAPRDPEVFGPEPSR